jgi:hypothetical protein
MRLANYVAQDIDALLIFAQAMHALHAITDSYDHNASALYATMLRLPQMQGLSSPRISLDASGDRLGKLTVYNMQLITQVPVGTFDTTTRSLSVRNEVQFASGLVPPSDGLVSFSLVRTMYVTTQQTYSLDFRSIAIGVPTSFDRLAISLQSQSCLPRACSLTE